MNRKFRVAFISQEYPPETGWGGIGSYTFEMANGLALLGVEVIVVCKAATKPSITTNGNLQIHRINPGPNWERFRGGWLINRFWPGFAFTSAQRLRELSKLKPIQLVEYPEARADGFFVSILLKQSKRIARLHTAWIFIDQMNKISATAPKKLTYWLEKQSILKADCITSPSQAILHKTEDWIPALKQYNRAVIPNPVDSLAFLPEAEKNDPPEIVFIGRMERHKGLETIMQALPEILYTDKSVIFRFLSNPRVEIDGDIAQTWVQRRLSESLHHRVLFGTVERNRLPDVLARASLCVMPSIWENFPYAVLEAMACGLPVVATRAGGLPELVEENVTGLLIPPQDPSALAQAVLQLLKNTTSAKNMGSAARTRIERHFSHAAVLPEMLKLYQRVAGN